MRRVEVEERDGRGALEALRFVVVDSHPLAQPAALTYGTAHTHEAERVAEPLRRVAARRVACAADAEAALADEEGHGQGRRGRRPRPWRSQALRSRVAPSPQRKKRARRGRPPQAEPPQDAVCDRWRGAPVALERAQDAPGGGVLATTGGAEGGADPEVLQA